MVVMDTRNQHSTQYLATTLPANRPRDCRQTAWAWDFQSASRSLRITEDGCGRPDCTPTVLSFSLQSRRGANSMSCGRYPAMSPNGRFCCRSPLQAFLVGDSVAMMRFATGAGDDGAAESR